MPGAPMWISAASKTATAAPAAHHQIGTQSRSEYSTEFAGAVEPEWGVESPDSDACSACRSAVTSPRVVATPRRKPTSVVSYDVSDEVTESGSEPSVDRPPPRACLPIRCPRSWYADSIPSFRCRRVRMTVMRAWICESRLR